MTEAKVIDAAQASEMSREEALRLLATAEGVPEKDRRLAQLMLAGPEMRGAPAPAPRPLTLTIAVQQAFRSMARDAANAAARDRADFAELGLHG